MKMQKTATDTKQKSTMEFHLSPEQQQVFNENYRGYEAKFSSLIAIDTEEIRRKKDTQSLFKIMDEMSDSVQKRSDKKEIEDYFANLS